MRLIALVGLFFVIALSFTTSSIIHAQDASSDDWTIEKRCISDPVKPPPDWTFDGTILYHGRYGIQGIRSDWQTTHVLAFTNIRTSYGVGIYIWDGNFSPDMKYFAAPVGFSTCGSVHCNGTLNEVYSVVVFDITGDAPRLHKRFKVNRFYYAEMTAEYDDAIVVWLDNNEFVYPTFSPDSYGYTNDVTLFNIVTDEQQTLPEESSPVCWRCSPDGTRQLVAYADTTDFNDVKFFRELRSYPQDKVLQSLEALLPAWDQSWSPDSQTFLAIDYDGDAAYLALYDRDGTMLKRVSPPMSSTIDLYFLAGDFDLNASPTGEYIWLSVGRSSEQPNSLQYGNYLLDEQQHVAYDLCQYAWVYWSPDGSHFAFQFNNKLAVYDPATGDTYQVATIGDYDYVLGWRGD